MLELIFSAVALGFMLSLVFIGPIFFLLIETSFSRGPRHALALDMGVIAADILCIIAAYFASKDIVHLIDQHPGFYRITALIIFIYGIYMFVSKTKMHIDGESRLINQNYFRTFINGFLLNLLNIGVLLFWLVTVISVRKNYPDIGEFTVYLGIVILTYFAIDLLKIYLAKTFHYKLTEGIANAIRKGVAVILVLFSIGVFMQSYAKYNRFEKQLEKAEMQEPKLK